MNHGRDWSRLNTAKLFQPLVPEDFVPRLRIQQRLNEIVQRPFTLVSAPAGYGKTTTMGAWLRDAGLRGAWLSLDEADNDPAVFLTYFLEAARQAIPIPEEHLPEGFETGAILSIQAFLETLYAALYEVEQDIVLVFDDCHVIRNDGVWAVFRELMRHPHPALHLVVISRHDPPLPLSDWRARHQMMDVRSADLRFVLEETADFIDKATDKKLDDETIALLQANTEGWAAGLRLVALSLTHTQALNDHILDLSANNYHILQYLADQVLGTLPRDMQRFLLQSSILERMSGSLCEAVVSPQDDALNRQGVLSEATIDGKAVNVSPQDDALNGQAVLRELYRKNLFMVSLDDGQQWFRYHHLFGDFLKSRLIREYSSEEVAGLHMRACRWLAEHGFIEEAIRHALAAGEMEQAVELVAANRHDLLNQERWRRLASWLALFPEQVVDTSPDLLLIKTWFVHTVRYDLEELTLLTDKIDTLIHCLDLEPVRAQRLLAENNVLRSIPHYYAVNPSTVLAYCRDGLAALPESFYMIRSYAHLYAAASLQMGGDLTGAIEQVHQGWREDLAFSAHPRTRNAGTEGFIRWMTADLNGVKRTAEQTLGATSGNRLHNSRNWGNYFLAITHYQRNDLASAEHYAQQVFNQRYSSPAVGNVHSIFLLVLVHQARGDQDAADEFMDKATAFAIDVRSKSLLFLVQTFQIELAIMRGELGKVGYWLSQSPAIRLPAMPLFYVSQLTLPKAMLAVNDPAHADRLGDYLRRLRGHVEAIHNTRCLIDVLALEALYADSLGDERAAFKALEHSLTLAQPGGFIRLYADLGPRMKGLLTRLSGRRIMPDYVAKILAAFPAGRPANPPPPQPAQEAFVEPLTMREREVLELLSMRLTNKEIAHTLVISPVTVKRHTINIYQKLYVQNRRDAVLTAQKLGILE